MDPKWRLLHVLWEHRTKLLVLMLIVSLVAPQPARAQFGIDWGAIVAAINSIGSAITNTIGPALRAINGALGTLNNLDEQHSGVLYQHRVSPGRNQPRAGPGGRGSRSLYPDSGDLPGERVERHAGQSAATRAGACCLGTR